MAEQKIIGDSILATKDTIFILQRWLGLLEKWQELGRIEPDEFAEACQQLKEAGLWSWVGEAGGHGIAALAEVVSMGSSQKG